ncbi:MAG: hypothetical protein RL173_2991 [Fibrobacterota bacterium]|jgi:hypothetical protein
MSESAVGDGDGMSHGETAIRRWARATWSRRFPLPAKRKHPFVNKQSLIEDGVENEPNEGQACLRRCSEDDAGLVLRTEHELRVTKPKDLGGIKKDGSRAGAPYLDTRGGINPGGSE